MAENAYFYWLFIVNRNAAINLLSTTQIEPTRERCCLDTPSSRVCLLNISSLPSLNFYLLMATSKESWLFQLTDLNSCNGCMGDVISLQGRDLWFLSFFLFLMWGNGATPIWMKISGPDCTLGISKATPRFQVSLEGLTGLGTYMYWWLWFVTATTVKRQRPLGAETRGNQAQASKCPLQSCSGVTQDVLNSSSYYLRQYVWNVVYQGSSLDTHCPLFLLGLSCRHSPPSRY